MLNCAQVYYSKILYSPVYKNVFECPPITKSMSSTSLAICLSMSKPECPNAMRMSTPSFFRRLASAATDGISGNIFTLPVCAISLNKRIQNVRLKILYWLHNRYVKQYEFVAPSVTFRLDSQMHEELRFSASSRK